MHRFLIIVFLAFIISALLTFHLSAKQRSEEPIIFEKYINQPSKKTFTNTIGMKFVLIPAGTFMMGSSSDEPARDIDERQHRATLSKDFYMQATEVTQGQWKRVMGDNPSYWINCDECPVEMVSWYDVQSFIKKLNQIEGTNKYRLPHEAEWEYACRAGSATAFANGDILEIYKNVKLRWFPYPKTGCGYDSNLDAIGWYCGNSKGKPHPVAQKNPNAWGLYDMHGNVWEHCQDWYGEYPISHVTDPKGHSLADFRVVRGGGWFNPTWQCRSANRCYCSSPYIRQDITGFRVARDF